MFQATRMMFIYVETPLHAGTGRALGSVDLPIQRERTTGYPMVQASSIKGRLRAEADPKVNPRSPLKQDEVKAIFGPETENAHENAGALSTGDARLLLFPVRSLAGVFAWVTSMNALARFARDAEMTGLKRDWTLHDATQPKEDEAWISGKALIAGESVVLEEFSFAPKEEPQVAHIGRWLAENALPQGQEYAYWREALPQKLCILHEDAFRDFVLYGTEVQTHIRLDPTKKTVAKGALWTSESLPTDTLLYAPLLATPSRAEGVNLSAEEVLQKVKHLNLARIQLGGDETTGQGIVAVRICGD